MNNTRSNHVTLGLNREIILSNVRRESLRSQNSGRPESAGNTTVRRAGDMPSYGRLHRSPTARGGVPHLLSPEEIMTIIRHTANNVLYL